MSKARRPRRRYRWRAGPGLGLYLGTTALVLVVGFFTQTNLLYASFGLLAGGLVVALVLPPLVLRKITVRRVLPRHAVAGEPVGLTYELCNTSRWLPAFAVVVHEAEGGPLEEMLSGLPHTWVQHLGPGQRQRVEAMAQPVRRGHLPLEQVELETSFPLGVARVAARVAVADELPVFPHIFRLNRRLMGQTRLATMNGRTPRDRRGGQEEFWGLRDYRPGDSLKHIDWRRSAAAARLVTREMTLPSPPRTVVGLDLSQAWRAHTFAGDTAADTEADAASPASLLRQRYGLRDEVERAISLAASVLHEALARGYKVGLLVEGAACPAFEPGVGMEHREAMLMALARLDPNERTEDQGRVAREATLVICAGPVGGRSYQGLVLSSRQIEQLIADQGEPAGTLAVQESKA